MTGQESRAAQPTDRLSYLWLAIGVLLSLFTVGKWVIPLAPWLSPVFLIRFTRTQRRLLWAYFLLAITSAIVTAIVLQGVLEGSTYISTIIGAALISNLPFVADRLLSRQFKGFISTLAFPLAFTALEFINVATNPLGSYGSWGYTQYGNLALAQLASITGLWGLTFLINWLGPVANWAWERSCNWPQIRHGVAIFAAILLAAVAYGSIRLTFFAPQGGTVRVAAFTSVDYRARQEELHGAKDNDWESFRQMSAEREDLYFADTIREARAGAQIILWPEMAIMAASEDEADLIARGREVAREEGIYLAMPIGIAYEDDAQPWENKLLLMSPDGDIVMEHFKYGGNVFEGSVLGDGILRTAETPFGTLSGIICWDTDFPATVRQAGRNGTDILLSPSLDYRSIDPMHAHMAAFRAIENGVSVVRSADNGLSVITDPYGRALAQTDHFTSSEWVTVAQVPTQGVFTLYPIIGDLFGWLAVVGLLIMIVSGVIQGRRAARAHPPRKPKPA